MKNVIIFGNTQTAQLAYWYLKNDTQHNVVAFTVERKFLNSEEFEGLPLIPFEDIETHFDPSKYSLFAPITAIKMNNIRKNVYLNGKNKGYSFISYISSKATVLTEHIGENCFILEDNTIQPFASIGNNVVLWSGNHIGHHSTINDHVFITSHVVIAGGCTVKERCFFGVNSCIKNNITIEEGTLVAMGAVVTNPTDADGLYIGSPAVKQKAPASRVY